MKKKLTFLAFAIALFAMAFAICASARTVYLEEIPDELKVPNDTATHFVVFEEEKYFSGSGATINGLVNSEMEADMAAAGIDASKIGTEYLTRYNFPAYMGETLITYVNLNSIKSNGYFWGKCGYVQLAGTVNQVHDMNQAVSQLRCIDFGKDSQISIIPESFADTATRLQCVKNFPKNLTLINYRAFNKCYRAFKGELYLNATTIRNGAFNNATSFITKLTFGPNTTTIENQSICTQLGEVTAENKPADNKMSLVELVFECKVSQITFATQGSASGSLWFEAGRDSRSAHEKLERIVLLHPEDEARVTEGSIFTDFTKNGALVMFDYDETDDFVTTVHHFDGAQRIIYENFLEKGQKLTICSSCGATEGEEVAPIFTFLGYSYKISNVNGGIECGYAIDQSLLSEYKELMGGEIEFGFIAFNVDSDGAKNATVLFEGGKLQITEKAIQVEINEINYSKIGITMTGFTASSANTNLALALYVTDKVENGGETTYTTSVFQGTKTTDGRDVVKGIYNNAGANLAYVSYNSIITEE